MFLKFDFCNRCLGGYRLAIVVFTFLIATEYALANDAISVHSNIPYAAGPRQSLDVYTPRDTQSDRPVAIFLYGGAWQAGKKADYAFVAETLAGRGIVTIIPDYRLYPEVRYPSFIEDAAAAFAWTKQNVQNYGGNPQRIFLVGHSSGAYLAAMLTLDPEYLASVGSSPRDIAGMIGISGLYDFLPITRPDIRAIFETAPALEATQPVTYALGNNPPILLITGENDETVPSRNTKSLASKLREKNGLVKTIYYPDLGHIGILLPFSPLSHSQTSVVDDVVNFLISTPPINNEGNH